MPPEAPRFKAGVGFALGAGVLSFDESPSSFLTLEATEPGFSSFSFGSTLGFAVAGSAFGLAGAGWSFAAGATGAAPLRVRRRTWGLAMVPYFLADAVVSCSFREYSATDLVMSARRDRSLWG